jgi:GGDEF domain-containing protein
VLAEINSTEAGELAQAIGATLSYPISLLTGQVKVKVSIGYAAIEQGSDPISSLRRADSAMYEAKRSGVGSLLWDSKIENLG